MGTKIKYNKKVNHNRFKVERMKCKSKIKRVGLQNPKPYPTVVKKSHHKMNRNKSIKQSFKYNNNKVKF